jgi:hypothetical protein
MTLRHAALAATLAALPLAPAAAQEGAGLSVELNKLETIEGGCRAYFLYRNALGREVSAYEMSLAILDPDGVIDRLLTVEAAPLPPDRTTLKIFEFPDLACEGIGEIIVHDISACAAADGQPLDCWAETALASRAAAPLTD